MEMAIRLLLYLMVGLALLVANLWFVRSVHKYFLSAEYVISPFHVIDPSASAAVGNTGEALAQMMAARLSNIQARLRASREVALQRSPSQADSANPIAATALFISRPVDVPTGLFEPVNINATLGGVEVSGVFSWLQRKLAEDRVLRFTTYERSDRSIITADLGNFAPGEGHVWFESDKHPDEIATNAAYALIQIKLAAEGPDRIRELELADFRQLLETIFQVDTLNRQALRGYVVESSFAELLPAIENQVQNVPNWPELIYLTGSIAEGAGNIGKAVTYYRSLQELGDEHKVGSDIRVIDWAAERLGALGPAGQLLGAEVRERFVSAAREFAGRMSLKGPDPQIAFVASDNQYVQAVWNTSERRYEVNPAGVDIAGLPQYIALMGRFFELNFDRCLGDQAETPRPSVDFWNEFRHSVVGYLIQTQPEFKDVSNVGTQYDFYEALKMIEAQTGAEPVKRLALELLERFQCDWNRDVIADRMLEISDDRGLMPREPIRQAMEGQGFAVHRNPN